jgi:deoxyribonuclease-4
VVLHAGSRKGDPHEEAMRRAAAAIAEALDEPGACPLLLENTAGAQGPLGRSFDELADLIELAGGDGRLGVCLDCCHLLASGFEVRDPASLGLVVDELDLKVGLDRLRCLHVNDSAVPLGANRDRHANLGDGELGPKGIATFLSEPRFEGLPALLEVPGPDGRGPDAAEVGKAKRLRRQGLRRR